MKELVVLSGKGGTGKTSIAGALAALAEDKILADCDVDAADLHLLLEPVVRQKHPFDYKTTFQEVCQERFGMLPEYRMRQATGPDHDRVFVMEISVDGDVLGEGSGKTKKEAQQQAACEPSGFVLHRLLRVLVLTGREGRQPNSSHRSAAFGPADVGRSNHSRKARI